MMAEGAARGPNRAQYLIEPFVAEQARGHLGGDRLFRLERIYIHVRRAERDARLLAMRAHEGLIAIALRTAQAMVHVQHGARMAQPAQHMQQHHAIDAAAHGNEQGLARRQQPLAADEALHGIDQVKGHRQCW